MIELTQIIGEYHGPVAPDDPDLTFVAMAGTGFDPDNLQHRQGSDALRYAIWIQQARDAKDWAKVDQLRDMVRGFGYDVQNTKTETRVRWMRMTLPSIIPAWLRDEHKSSAIVTEWFS